MMLSIAIISLICFILRIFIVIFLLEEAETKYFGIPYLIITIIAWWGICLPLSICLIAMGTFLLILTISIKP